MVLVVLENQRGNIHPFSLEAVAAGQKFAQELNCELSILCIGEKVDELRTQAQNFKSNKLITAQNSLIDMYSADGYSKVLSDVISSMAPKYVLMGHSYMVRDFVPRVSFYFYNNAQEVDFLVDKINKAIQVIK